MEIVLVRHGETDWNRAGRHMGQQDIPLNDMGREQALIMKEKLAGTVFDCCYASPLKRAKETAEIICANKCEIIFDERLKERYGGDMEGKVFETWEEYLNNPTIEKDNEILERAQEFFSMIKNKNYKRILIVSHNGLLKNLQHCILGETGNVDYSKNNLKNCEIKSYNI